MNYNLGIRYKKFLNILFFSLLCVLFTYPILPNAIQSLVIGLLIIVSIILYRKDFKKKIKTIGLKPIVLSSLWVILIIISLTYTPNQEKGLKLVLRLINFAIFPFLFFYLIPKISDRKKSLLYFFYVSSHLFLIIFLIVKLMQGLNTIGYINEQGIRIRGPLNIGVLEQFKIILKIPLHVSRYYINENKISTFFIHKAYLSMGFLWSSILIINNVLFKENKKIIKCIGVVLILIFIFGVVYFTSIPNLISLLILPLFVIWKLNSKKNKIILFSIMVLAPIFIISLPSIQNRIFNNVRLKTDFDEAKNMITNMFSKTPQNNANIRVNVWSCAIHQFTKKPIFGYGIGSENEILKKCTNLNLNSHNYFLSLLISGGVIVLLAFIFFLVSSLGLAFITNNKIYVVFLILLCINLMAESMFIRIHGILFSSIFGSLLYRESLYLKANK
ncbi:O-antigen polymerase [Lacinutrix sp. 5H-3-7-4]|nr:O-antigen polymerase [Lacinutrix sp. 5H-3-7-4]